MRVSPKLLPGREKFATPTSTVGGADFARPGDGTKWHRSPILARPGNVRHRRPVLHVGARAPTSSSPSRYARRHRRQCRWPTWRRPWQLSRRTRAAGRWRFVFARRRRARISSRNISTPSRSVDTRVGEWHQRRCGNAACRCRTRCLGRFCRSIGDRPTSDAYLNVHARVGKAVGTALSGGKAEAQIGLKRLRFRRCRGRRSRRRGW